MTSGDSTLETIEFELEESPTRVSVTSDVQEIKFHGRTIGPYRAGQEVEVPYRIAVRLVTMGYAKFREERMSLGDLSKIHWKETVPSTRQLPDLQPDFYFRLRRFLADLQARSEKDRTVVKDYEKALSLARDIVSTRVKKIAFVSAAPETSSEVMKGLTLEERVLFETLRKAIASWREKLLVVE